MNVDEISVLIADDVNSTRFQIRDLLKESGFKKLTMVGSGEEAKVYLQAEPINLVLCDWYMSPTDGFELLKWVRANAQLKQTPFIMVTGESTKERVIDAIQAGVDDYLVKPLTMVQVQSKVFNVLIKKKVL
jgi:two-component system, chemotaxis family, chemotaxis protein CheY